MGNQIITAENLRERYDNIVKAYEFSGVLINSEEAGEKLWTNKIYIPDLDFLHLANLQMEASIGNSESKAKFKSHVFDILMRYAPATYSPVAETIELNIDTGKKKRRSMRDIRDAVYVRCYLSPEGSEDRTFWEDIFSSEEPEMLKKLSSWDPQWADKL